MKILTFLYYFDKFTLNNSFLKLLRKVIFVIKSCLNLEKCRNTNYIFIKKKKTLFMYFL